MQSWPGSQRGGPAPSSAAAAPPGERPWDAPEDVELLDVGGLPTDGDGGRRGPPRRGDRTDYSWQELADMTEVR